MTVARKRRRRRSLAPRPRPEAILEPGALALLPSWHGVVVSAQLPAPWLAMGLLPAMAVGDVLDLAPAVWMDTYMPIGDEAGFLPLHRPDGDWWCGEAGTVVARGALVDPEDAGGQVYLLDVAGRTFPLNWTNPEPFLAPEIEASGGLYLDPRLAPDGDLGLTGDHCRRPFRVTALRRYRVRGVIPHDPTSLDRLPDPWDAETRSVSYIADLVAASDEA